MQFRIPFILFLLLSISTQAYTDRKAILLVNRNLQKDSIGYNIADDISRVVYAAFQNEQIKLWDSPEKKKQITKDELLEKEKNTHTRFIAPRNIFIYETWTLNRKKYKFNTRGISISAQDTQGNESFLGYAEMNEPLKKIFAEAYANVNANGFYGTTVLQELQSRNFEYDLVFFKNKAIHNFKKGLKIKKQALSAKNILWKNDIPQTKLVEYSVEPGPSVLTAKSAELIKALQDFFNENPQEFYNLGGDKMFSFTKSTPIIISNFYVKEIWTKSHDSLLTKPVQYTPFVVGTPLESISPEQVEAWKVKCKEEHFNKLIFDKGFYYRLIKINASPISAELSEKSKEKLNNWQNNIL